MKPMWQGKIEVIGSGLALLVILVFGSLAARADGGCQDQFDCSEAELCARESGLCAGEGTCVQWPEACLQVYDPVCGCDGQTYSSGCDAALHGIGVSHSGECVFENDCPAGGPENSCGESAYCGVGAGQCGVQQLGTCQPRPEICTEQWDPVCACDGQTYGNACEAAAAGVNIDTQGVCSSADECVANAGGASCGTDQYCAIGIGQCGVQPGGTCEATPGVCTFDYFPVCGCDGVTYANACGAAAAGINIEQMGECASGNSCTPTTSNESCRVGEYCAIEFGQCGEEVVGQCEPMAQACSMDLNPVCGCDGNTHTNACNASAAGVNVASVGECGQVAASVPGIASWPAWVALGVLLVGTGGWMLRRGRSSPVGQ